MVDILLATHNSEKYLRELLDSLFAQTYRDFRIVAGDDGSTDNTIAILREYASLHPDMVILESERPLGGAMQNFFHLIGYANAEYVLFADHDDVWYPAKAEDTLARMREMEKMHGQDTPILVHTDLEVVDENLKTLAPSMMHAQRLSKTFVGLNRLLVQNYVTGCTVMVNAALIRKVKYKSMGSIVMHDWWLALVASAFGAVGFLDKPTIKYRQHGRNEVGAKYVVSAAYVKDNLSHTDRQRQRMINTYLQAGEFYETYKDELPAEKERIVLAYAEFIHLNKLQKWARMIRYNFFKKGLVRKVGQFILG